jgi:hypothetical protein
VLDAALVMSDQAHGFGLAESFTGRLSIRALECKDVVDGIHQGVRHGDDGSPMIELGTEVLITRLEDYSRSSSLL